MSRRLLSALACLLPGVALAQPLDHLKCYKVRDRLKLSAVVDLQSALGLEQGCTVSRTRFLCVPAAKTVVQTNVPLLPIDGQELTDQRLCYKIKCAAPFPSDQTVADQFGFRTVTNLRSSMLCTPVAHPCGGTPGQCTGFCDAFNPAGCQSPIDCNGNQLPCGCYGSTTTCTSSTSTSSTTLP